MKMINAYIQEFMPEKIADVLREKHIHGITILKCMGFGHQTDEESKRLSISGQVQAANWYCNESSN